MPLSSQCAKVKTFSSLRNTNHTRQSLSTIPKSLKQWKWVTQISFAFLLFSKSSVFLLTDICSSSSLNYSLKVIESTLVSKESNTWPWAESPSFNSPHFFCHLHLRVDHPQNSAVPFLHKLWLIILTASQRKAWFSHSYKPIWRWR